MAVYVDNFLSPYRSPSGRVYRMSHMTADSEEELLSMVDAVGVHRSHHQYAGTLKSHFDISASKRALAIKRGAVEVTVRQMARMVSIRRKTGVLPKPDPGLS